MVQGATKQVTRMLKLSIELMPAGFEPLSRTRKEESVARGRTLPCPASGMECAFMLNKRTAQGPSYLFVSAKTAFTPIPARHAARRDALIEASLDQEVHSISYVASACLASERIELDAVVVERADDRWLLDVVPARRIRNVEEERLAQIALSELGLKSIVLTAEEIRREPRYTNARMVWSYRDTPVSVGLRMRILQTLLDDGPMPLGELLKSIRSERDPVPAVMALACADLLCLDLVPQPLTPATIVRYRG